MKHLDSFGDERHLGVCIHCGGVPTTREHVASLVFLDEPYPAELHVAAACRRCNEASSLDEAYVACLIECTIAGSADPALVRRQKVSRILKARPALAARLAAAGRELDGQTYFQVEESRVRNVALKLARGHAAYEFDEPCTEPPVAIEAIPLALMDDTTRDRFETVVDQGVWPEVGSRAMQRLAGALETGLVPWVEVQEGRYRFLTCLDGSDRVVRMVLSEYLACEVRWSSNTEFGRSTA